MDTDRNLLFGVLALQMDFIDNAQFVEACTVWTTRKSLSLGELLLEKGWLTAADTADIERLLERKLKKLGGNARAGLAAAGDDVKRSLAALEDEEIQRSLADLPSDAGHPVTLSMEGLPEPSERYKLSRVHARGGIGRVWLAHDGQLGRNVALKELRPERADNAKLWARFLQEARITGQLEHPGIVPVYELGRRPDNHQPFYAMRFVKGRTLSEAARAYHKKRQAGQEEPLDLLTLLNAFVVVCNTIAYAHSRGVIHRDLKGHNVILGDFGEVVVLDWGLAKLVDQPSASDVETMELPSPLTAEEGSDEVELTAQGQAMGTPAYMAPEQAAGLVNQIGRPTDVYGLGAILYEILAGQPPFTGSDTHDVLRKVRHEEPVPPSQHWPGVPQALEVACLRALAKEPADRFASAAELGQVVQVWQEVQRRQAEETLRRQTAILHSILDSMSEGVTVRDEAGKFVLWNPAVEEILGQPVTGQPLEGWVERFGCYLPDKVTFFPTAALPMARAMRGEEVDEAEMYIRNAQRPDGVWLSINARPLKDDKGHARGGVGVFRDITKRKRAEEALAAERNLLRSLIDNLPDFVYVKDRDSRYVVNNVAHARLLGARSPEAMVGKTVFDFYPRQLAEGFHADDQTVLHSGQPLVNREEADIGPDQKRHWHSTTKVPLRDPHGNIVGLVGISRDITRERAAQQALRESEAFYHSLVENLPQNIYRKDRDGRFTFANQRFCAMLGKPLEDVVGKTDAAFFPPHLVEKYRRDDQRVLTTGKMFEAVEDHVTPAGEKFYIQIIKTPIHDAAGQIIGTQGIFWDVTERERAEIALAEERNLLRTLIDSLPDHIYIKDTGGRYLVDNLAHQRFLGLSASAEVVGKTVFDFFPHELAARFHADDLAIVRSGQALCNREEPIVDRTGRRRLVATSKIPLRDTQGKIIGLVCVSRDITVASQAAP